ncbi:MAG: nucleotidyltransferase domain-containing protein [Oceanospirillaceae bacterium]|nr:nucleotidyltransferase domain-containing protein [Oceanospirillaceae bacterium]
MNSGLQFSVNKILNHYLTKTIKSDENLSGYLSNNICELISEIYNSFPRRVDDDGYDYICVEPLSVEVSKDDPSYRVIVEIADIFNSLPRSYFKAVILHGSYGDNTPVAGWSDIDIFCVLSRELATCPESLKKLRRELNKIHKLMLLVDPLQHHGVQIVTEYDLNNYSSNFVPMAALAKGRSLLASQSVVLRYKANKQITNNSAEIVVNNLLSAKDSGEFKTHSKSGIYLPYNRSEGHYMYQLKYFISMNLLFPALFLSDINCPCHKADSFDKFYRLVPPEASRWWKILEEIRIQWGIREGRSYVPNKIPSWVSDAIGECYFDIAINSMKLALESEVYKARVGG